MHVCLPLYPEDESEVRAHAGRFVVVVFPGAKRQHKEWVLQEYLGNNSTHKEGTPFWQIKF